MMKNVLIPTDLTVESLQLVEYAVLNFPQTKLNVLLVVGCNLPDTRWGVTHFNPKEYVRTHLSAEFIAAKRRLLLEHGNSIENISFELFLGINLFAFQNFIEQLGVEDAVVPQGVFLHYPNGKWFDTTKFIRKKVKNVVEAPVGLMNEVPRKNFSFISLFNL